MIDRRGFILGLAAAPAACVPAIDGTETGEADWRPHFASLSRPAILIDTERRRLFFWAAGNTAYREFPVGIARADELLRKGRTSVVRKQVGPDWRPTPSMLRRNPSLPRYVPPGPENPLGAYALYLGWQYFAIHGTNDPVTVGRRTTSGCFRLLPGHIEWLYRNAPAGTQVRVV